MTSNLDIYCISIKERQDRKRLMNAQTKYHNFKLKYHIVEKHENPKRGCLESHLSVLRRSIKESKNDKVLILEDDAKLLKPLSQLPKLPEKWDILYLGGTVFSNLGKYNENWTKIITWTCHAYIINKNNENLIKDILDAENYDMEIDEYLIKHIQRKYLCYMITPMMAIQRDGFSDIENAKVTYDFMTGTLDGFRQPEHNKNEEGEYVLKLDSIPPPALPNVSIITPTYNRNKFFPLAIKNFIDFDYPPEKLEWIIIDDSEDDSLRNLLPKKDNRIKYNYIGNEGRHTVSKKRNLGVKLSTNDIIIHMDDDDVYPVESIKTRVKILLKYQKDGIECVGCSRIAVYDIINNKSSIATDGNISLSEASMGYFKSFWQKQKFNDYEPQGEYKSFIANRFNKIIDIPYSFVICSTAHNNNFVEKNRNIKNNGLKHKDTGKELNFYDNWDDETQMIIDEIKKLL